MHAGSNSPLTLGQRVTSGKQSGSYQYMSHIPPESDKISSVLQALKSYCCIRKKIAVYFQNRMKNISHVNVDKQQSVLMLRMAVQCGQIILFADYPWRDYRRRWEKHDIAPSARTNPHCNKNEGLFTWTISQSDVSIMYIINELQFIVYSWLREVDILDCQCFWIIRVKT